MSKVYVIGDLHFGHKKLQDIRGISDQDLVDRWNSVVTKRDVVYVLGDVFCVDRIPELLGIKKLILGNHDRKAMPVYLSLFHRVSAMHEWDNCLLTHIPVHPGQRHRFRKNVHGHLHAHTIPDDWYVCASAEQINYTPRLLRDMVDGLKD